LPGTTTLRTKFFLKTGLAGTKKIAYNETNRESFLKKDKIGREETL
jgi:hypothetical protein